MYVARTNERRECGGAGVWITVGEPKRCVCSAALAKRDGTYRGLSPASRAVDENGKGLFLLVTARDTYSDDHDPPRTAQRRPASCGTKNKSVRTKLGKDDGASLQPTGNWLILLFAHPLSIVCSRSAFGLFVWGFSYGVRNTEY